MNVTDSDGASDYRHVTGTDGGGQSGLRVTVSRRPGPGPGRFCCRGQLPLRRAVASQP